MPTALPAPALRRRPALRRARAATLALGVTVVTLAGACGGGSGRSGSGTAATTRSTAEPSTVGTAATAGTYVPPEALAALDPPAGDPGPVLLYGDSLVQQSFGYAQAIAQHQGFRLAGGGFGGLALCDVLDGLARSVRDDAPRVVILSFVGNAITPCITAGGDPGTVRIARRYERDARRAVAIARAGGARVILIAPPHMRTPDREVVAQAITDRWDRIARDTPEVTVVDAAAALSPGGYTDTLPCRDYETADLGCRGGRIVVRQDDGTHLSPTYGGSGYSAGGWRYAEILTGGV